LEGGVEAVSESCELVDRLIVDSWAAETVEESSALSVLMKDEIIHSGRRG
jgi:hypothetical protein